MTAPPSSAISRPPNHMMQPPRPMYNNPNVSGHPGTSSYGTSSPGTYGTSPSGTSSYGVSGPANTMLSGPPGAISSGPARPVVGIPSTGNLGSNNSTDFIVMKLNISFTWNCYFANLLYHKL